MGEILYTNQHGRHGPTFHSGNPEFLLRFLRILPQLFKTNWVEFEKGFGYAPGILDLECVVFLKHCF